MDETPAERFEREMEEAHAQGRLPIGAAAPRDVAGEHPARCPECGAPAGEPCESWCASRLSRDQGKLL